MKTMVKDLSIEEMMNVNGGHPVIWYVISSCVSGILWDAFGHWDTTSASLKKGADSANAYWDKQ